MLEKGQAGKSNAAESEDIWYEIRKLQEAIEGNGRQGLKERMLLMETAVGTMADGIDDLKKESSGVRTSIRNATLAVLGSLVVSLFIFFSATVYTVINKPQFDEASTKKVISQAVIQTLQEMKKEGVTTDVK